MDNFISFISDNIVFVFIAIGVIYSLFSRKAPTEQKTNRMPSFGGDGQQRPQRPQVQQPQRTQQQHTQPQRSAQQQSARPKPARAEASRTGPSVIQSRSQPESGRRSVLFDEMMQDADQSQTADQKRMEAVHSGAAVPRHSAMNAGAVSGDELTKAIVWAEILGPPRAHKPYRR